MNSDLLENRVAAYCRENHISGLLQVKVRDELRHFQPIGLADAENSVPFSRESMFSLYSLSKPFCAIGLLKLADRNLVQLDSHPVRYLPEAEGFDPRVTLRHLLHHISGLPDFEQLQEFSRAHAPGYARYAREHVRLLSQYPSSFAPGMGAQYANVNFLLPALIIENVSDMPYGEYMKKEVFAPLGMNTAVVDHESLFIPRRVKGYELQEEALREVPKSHNWMLGAGDIVGTADDVYCLNLAIKRRLLLKEETWNAVLTPSPLNHMGMGCTVTRWHGKTRITHNGGHTGFRTLHIQLPEDDFDLIFLSNSGFGNARADLSEMVYSAFYEDQTSPGHQMEMDKGYI